LSYAFGRGAIPSYRKSSHVITRVESITVLVVEDETDIRNLLDDILTLEGFNVTTADTPSRAMELVKKSSPNLVLMDLMLPGMSGFELAETLRQERDLPIIAMSASNFLLQEALRWPHFVAAVTKPFDWDMLIGYVKNYAR
jgi:CheY-like chemotaxis protein